MKGNSQSKRDDSKQRHKELLRKFYDIFSAVCQLILPNNFLVDSSFCCDINEDESEMTICSKKTYWLLEYYEILVYAVWVWIIEADETLNGLRDTSMSINNIFRAKAENISTFEKKIIAKDITNNIDEIINETLDSGKEKQSMQMFFHKVLTLINSDYKVKKIKLEIQLEELVKMISPAILAAGGVLDLLVLIINISYLNIKADAFSNDVKKIMIERLSYILFGKKYLHYTEKNVSQIDEDYKFHKQILGCVLENNQIMCKDIMDYVVKFIYGELGVEIIDVEKALFEITKQYYNKTVQTNNTDQVFEDIVADTLKRLFNIQEGNKDDNCRIGSVYENYYLIFWNAAYAIKKTIRRLMENKETNNKITIKEFIDKIIY